MASEGGWVHGHLWVSSQFVSECGQLVQLQANVCDVQPVLQLCAMLRVAGGGPALQRREGGRATAARRGGSPICRAHSTRVPFRKQACGKAIRLGARGGEVVQWDKSGAKVRGFEDDEGLWRAAGKHDADAVQLKGAIEGEGDIDRPAADCSVSLRSPVRIQQTVRHQCSWVAKSHLRVITGETFSTTYGGYANPLAASQAASAAGERPEVACNVGGGRAAPHGQAGGSVLHTTASACSTRGQAEQTYHHQYSPRVYVRVRHACADSCRAGGGASPPQV